MSYEITIPDKSPAADVALVGGARGMRTNVYGKLTLGCEGERAPLADQRLLGDVTPTMRRHVAFDRKSLLTDIARIRPFTGVHALVCVQAAFLRESLEAQLALKRPLTGVRSHVHFQIWLTTETRLANCTVVRLVPRVQLHVNVVRRRRREHLSTNLAWLRL